MKDKAAKQTQKPIRTELSSAKKRYKIYVNNSHVRQKGHMCEEYMVKVNTFFLSMICLSLITNLEANFCMKYCNEKNKSSTKKKTTFSRVFSAYWVEN